MSKIYNLQGNKYSSVSSLVKEINENPTGWMIMKVVIPDNPIKPTYIYRMLNNSKSSVGGVTNREYFKKNSSGGFYAFYSENRLTKVIYCFRSNTLRPVELNVRIRKIVPFADVSILNPTDLMDFPFEQSKIQMVGVDYFNQMSS